MAMCITLHDPFESRLLVIQEELRTTLNRVPGVPQSMIEELLAEGKCGLYALLVLLTGDACQAQEEQALRAAVGMELLMLAIKGQEAAEDGAAARGKLLAGSFLQTEALSLCADLPAGVVQSFAELCRQMLQEKTRRKEQSLWPEMTERAYLERAYSRSALFAATCGKVGARLGTAASEVEEALTAYGYWLGMALQVQEDLRLVRALPVRAGRVVAQARASGGVPLPMGSARAVMRSYVNKAKKSLSVLSASLAKSMLLDVTNSLFEQPE